MRRIGEILLLGIIGAFLCAFLFWISFIIQAAIDGSNLGEAAAYGILFGMGAFAIGGVLGAFIALMRANLLGGGVLGAAGVAFFVLLWAVTQSDAGSFSRALSRSLPFAVFYGLPTVLTGVLVAWLRIRRERRRVALTPGQPV